MSLINDALKRAKQVPPPPRSPGLLPGARVTPVENRSSPRWPLVAVPLIVLGAVSLAVFLLVKGVQGVRHQAKLAPEWNVAAREALAPDDGAGLAALLGATGALAGAGSSNQPPSSAGGVAAGPGAALPAEPTFPKLKLQGIFWRPSRPSVVINAQTLYRGDRLEGATVVAITKDSATVEWHGKRRVLMMR